MQVCRNCCPGKGALFFRCLTATLPGLWKIPVFTNGVRQMDSFLKSLLLFSVVLSVSMPALSQPNQLTPEEAAEGWQLLFDGQTAGDWRVVNGTRFPSEAWTIEDGCFKSGINPKISKDLIYPEKFTDFELKFEWKIQEKGNAGVKYMVHEIIQDPDRNQRRRIAVGLTVMLFLMPIGIAIGLFKGKIIKPFLRRILWIVCLLAVGFGFFYLNQAIDLTRPSNNAVGFEYQLYDDRDTPELSPNLTAGALYDLYPPLKRASRQPGEFNQARILVAGNHVEHWLNDEKILEFELGSEDLKQRIAESKFRRIKGFGEKAAAQISLQNHRDDIWYRNIKIRRLD